MKSLENILHKVTPLFLYGFVFFLPWHIIWILQETHYANEKWQYGTIGIYLSDMFLFAWLFSVLFSHTQQISQWFAEHKKITALFLLTELWIFVSIFWSHDQTIAFYHALIFGCAMSLTFCLWIMPLSMRYMSMALIVTANIHALIGIHQFLTQSFFSHTYLGISPHETIWGGTATITAHGERWLRAYGGFPHPNILGGFLIAALLLTITIYITTRHKKNLHTFLLLLSCGILTSNIIVTFSRTTWTAATISICMLFLFYFIHTKKKFSQLVAPIITICATICVFMLFFNTLLFSRVTHDTQAIHNSFDDRKTYMTHAIDLISQNPLLGTGIGNYTNTAYHTHNASDPIWFFQPVHNAYVLICAEIGIIGLLIICIFIVICITSFFRNKLWKSSYRITYILIFFTVCIISFFDHWPWSSHFGILFSTLCIGLFAKQKNKVSKNY